ncbi:MAG TPA: hypothetical protein VJA25_09895 [Dehalococcoidia bacterium]|nr:hypothetical protein [Dehalococcoidia bacterium]
MGKKVERAIRKVQAKVGNKGRAIAILKSQGTIKQKGRHLVGKGGR